MWDSQPRDVEQRGAMWDRWYNACILSAMRYPTIEFDQKIGNNTDAPRRRLQVVSVALPDAI